MANLDWQKHDAEIVGFVRGITDFYLRTSATTGKLLNENQGILLRNNYATPRLIGNLLVYLDILSNQVFADLESTRSSCLTSGKDLETCVAGSTTYMAIFIDYQNWVERLDEYKAQTQAAFERNPDASGNEDDVFWDNVTKPLILGWFPGMKRQRRLDAVTPLVMAWQIEVAKAAYDEASRMFWHDLKESAKNVYEQATTFGAFGILLAITGLAIGYGYGRGK